MIRGEKQENLSPGSGNLGFGIDKFFRFGDPLKDVPQKPTKLEGAFYYASQLLALKPWSVFAPFEILKVTITKDNEETIRWVMCTSHNSGNGSEKSNSPFGSIQIQKDLSDLTTHFGRDEMYLRSGMSGQRHYPDRLYVSADPIGNVHFDTIYLLKHMFGNSISPETSRRFSGTEVIEGGKTILDFGVIPNMEVQTGRPDAYLTEDSMGRSFGRRPLTSNELDIVPKVCYYCREFAKEHKLLGIKPSGGSFQRTYPDAFSRGNDSVKIEYNLDRKFGGIWNSEQKWMWFD